MDIIRDQDHHLSGRHSTDWRFMRRSAPAQGLSIKTFKIKRMGHQFRKERPRTNENNPVLRINLGFSANDRLSENNKEKLLKKTEKLVMNKVTNRKTMQSWIGTINHATIVFPNLRAILNSTFQDLARFWRAPFDHLPIPEELQNGELKSYSSKRNL